MSRLKIVQPVTPSSVAADRGVDVGNLLKADPKEVWADTATGTAASITIDLGFAQPINTILLGHVRPPLAGATWAISGGAFGPNDDVIQGSAPLRVPDRAGRFSIVSHALWTGAPVNVRWLRIAITQPAGGSPLTVGTLVVGQAFVAEFGQEWGAGRQPLDTGVATPLPSGGFSIVEGVRKRRYGWTFGDLSVEEADALEAIALALGETRPGLVIEDDARTPGLRDRIWYAKFERWKQYERRNRKQTRWELGVEEWV